MRSSTSHLSVLGSRCRDARPSRSELIGRSVTVEFPAVSDWVSIRVEGEIKNAVLIRPGLIRAGVEFVGLSEAERAIATVLGVLTAIDEEWAESQAIRPTDAAPGHA